MSFVLPRAIHALQALYGSYLLSLSARSILQLRQYEETSEKLAKYSNVAADELRHTRTTQGVGAGSITLSLITSLTLIFYSPSSTSTTTTTTSSISSSLVPSLLNILALELSRRHMASYWRGKKRVPLPGTAEYNDAMAKTQNLVGALGYLEASWIAVGGLKVLGMGLGFSL